MDGLRQNRVWNRLEDDEDFLQSRSVEECGGKRQALRSIENEDDSNRMPSLGTSSLRIIPHPKRDRICKPAPSGTATQDKENDPPLVYCRPRAKQQPKARLSPGLPRKNQAEPTFAGEDGLLLANKKEDDEEGFEIKTVLSSRKSKSTIVGWTPGKGSRGNRHAATMDDQLIKEELRNLEAHFLGIRQNGELEEPHENGSNDKAATVEKLADKGREKKRRSRRASETGKDSAPLLSERRKLSDGASKNRRGHKNDDYARTIDFSALRQTSGAGTGANLRASADSLSSEATKPTRRSLRKGSLTRSIKMFQECMAASFAPSLRSR